MRRFYPPSRLSSTNASPRRVPQVSREMIPYMGECYGNPSSGHVLGRACKSAMEKARERVASMLGCYPDEIVFAASGSEADNHAILGAVRIRGSSW